MYNSIRIKDKNKRKAYPVDFKGAIVLFFCLVTFYYLILIGLRIAILVLSIIGFSSGYKTFYLLSILPFFVLILFPFLLYFIPKTAPLIFTIILEMSIFSYIMDGMSYYFFFSEEINSKSLFILLIINDEIILPALVISIMLISSHYF